jgi:hypothetical protein
MGRQQDGFRLEPVVDVCGDGDATEADVDVDLDDTDDDHVSLLDRTKS